MNANVKQVSSGKDPNLALFGVFVVGQKGIIGNFNFSSEGLFLEMTFLEKSRAISETWITILRQIEQKRNFQTNCRINIMRHFSVGLIHQIEAGVDF